MTLVPRSVTSRRSFIFHRGGINRREISCRTGKGPFSCLESSYSSEALDSFGWRSAVLFFAGVSEFLLFDFFFHASSWVLSLRATCILCFFFFLVFSFLMSNFVNNLFPPLAPTPFPPPNLSHLLSTPICLHICLLMNIQQIIISVMHKLINTLFLLRTYICMCCRVLSLGNLIEYHMYM